MWKGILNMQRDDEQKVEEINVTEPLREAELVNDDINGGNTDVEIRENDMDDDDPRTLEEKLGLPAKGTPLYKNPVIIARLIATLIALYLIGTAVFSMITGK